MPATWWSAWIPRSCCRSSQPFLMSPFPRYRLRHQKPATIPALPGSGSRSSKGSNDMTLNRDPSTFLDQEKEALGDLGRQRIINALGERIEGAFRPTEFLTPAGTLVSAYRHKEDQAHYVQEGEDV